MVTEHMKVKPEHLSALWARVGDLLELIAHDMHVPSNIDEFDALRAVLRVLDPLESAHHDRLLGPDN